MHSIRTCMTKSAWKVMFLVVLVAHNMSIVKTSLTCLDIPGRPSRAYVNLADLNLGSLLSVSGISKDSLCEDTIRLPVLQQLVEAIAFAVKKINEDNSILPNVKLGFAVLDDCSKESTTTAQALRFIPRIAETDCRKYYQKSPSVERNTYDYYDVVGIIGPLRSPNSVVASHVLGPARIPQISFLSTSDVLSRKDIHPYFLRVVPPDAHQMKAILEFISRNGWSYFSVLYDEGSYGETAYENIKQSIRDTPLCIAAQHKLYVNMDMEEYRNIINDLRRKRRARVVILVTGDERMRKTFETVHNLKLEGRFIWIGTDGWAERVSSLKSIYRKAIIGSFTTTFYAPPAEEFVMYFRSLNPSNSDNPWLHEFWERMFNCSFMAKTCNESLDVTTSPHYSVVSQAVYGIDAVYAYAHGIHNLINNKCPSAKGIAARNCVKGPALLEYLKNVSFIGQTGQVIFDKFGDRIGKYIIKQILPSSTQFYQKEVSIIDAQDSYKISITNNITWDYVLPLKSDFGPSARYSFPPKTDLTMIKSIPLSVCSRLCELGERIIIRQSSCCWDCRNCRENERLASNSTICLQCPEFSWPDKKTNFTSCIPIEPTFPVHSDPFVIIIICFSVAGAISTTTVFIIFVIHRSARVIKASSRELSFFQLGALLFGYMTMMVYVMRPSDKLCVLIYFIFSLSFSSLYAPLLIKTIRIYRIFHLASKGQRTLKAVSPLSQMMLTLSIIFGQLIICLLVAITSHPRARLSSPSKDEKYVELSCYFTEPGLVSHFFYNFTLVCLCSIFAFKTRKLPDNFNESRFIAMCVFTTLVLWLAIVPSFIAASGEYMRSILLASALLLNHSVALIFLFVSRIYAIFYVDEINSEPVHQETSHHSVRRVNCVTPINVISSSPNFLKPGPSGYH